MTAVDLYITFVKLGWTGKEAYEDVFSQGCFSLRELLELQRYCGIRSVVKTA